MLLLFPIINLIYISTLLFSVVFLIKLTDEHCYYNCRFTVYILIHLLFMFYSYVLFVLYLMTAFVDQAYMHVLHVPSDSKK